MKHTTRALVLAFVAAMVVGIPGTARAADLQPKPSTGQESNWPDWRGPTADGRSKATDLPLRWSETENIVWKTAIHDLGFSTPVVWGNQIWLTTANRNGKALYAVCVDLKSGRIVHDVEVFRPKKPQRIHSLNSYATPSAVVQEGRCYVHYGTHGTACLNSKTGKVLWRRDNLNCDHMQGPVSSPVLFEDLLIIHLEGIDVQFIAALNTKTGETAWKVDRPKELYNDDIEPVYRKAYHTPVLVEVDGKTQLISNGALLVTGHEPRTGKEIWRVRYRDDNTISRIVSGHGIFFVNCGGPPTDPHLWAIRQGGLGDVTDTHVVWKMTEDVPLESSPVLVDDLLYTLTVRGLLICKEAVTGKTIWSQNLPGQYGASPVYADGRIYIAGKQGKVTIIKPGREYHELAANEINGGLWASPAVAGKSILLRTKTHLYRICKKQQ